MNIKNTDEISITALQRLKMRVYGHTQIGYAKKAGWKEKVPLFAFDCNTHGVVCNTPQGHMQWLLCPRCFDEETTLTHDIQGQLQLDIMHNARAHTETRDIHPLQT